MFIFFAENKANYSKGQIFPFVIAALAILITMAMITANLGRVAIFKTDVSNAADAGALAGVSGLSAWLLGLGLTSDTWCGTAVVTVARMLQIFIFGRDDIKIPSFNLFEDGEEEDSEESDLDEFPNDLVAAIKLYVQHYLKYFIASYRLELDNKMAWANAKQAALKSAFGNSGVDERVDWVKRFKHYGGSYDSYVKDFMSSDANKTGFAQFMEHPISGFASQLGEIGPGTESDTLITSGYGWRQTADENFEGSFPGSNNYTAYDNYVEVQVEGIEMYPIETLTFAEYFGSGVTAVLTALVLIGAYIKYIEDCDGWWCYILSAIYAIIDAAVFFAMLETLPCGFTFEDRDIERWTRDNPLLVQVTRHKTNVNMGIWNFQYGNVVGKSGAHAFQDDSDVTVEPVLVESIMNLGGSWSSLASLDTSEWFRTELHLFETELAPGYIE